MVLRNQRHDEVKPGMAPGARTPPIGEQPAHENESRMRQAELVISHVLRGGVLLSAGIILVGVVAFYHGYLTVKGSRVSFGAFPHTLTGVVAGVAHGDPLAIILLGLLVLLATPVVRVAVSIIAFALDRDWQYVVITSVVLVILMVSFIVGKGGA